jgi:hypothetical protein
MDGAKQNTGLCYFTRRGVNCECTAIITPRMALRDSLNSPESNIKAQGSASFRGLIFSLAWRKLRANKGSQRGFNRALKITRRRHERTPAPSLRITPSRDPRGRRSPVSLLRGLNEPVEQEHRIVRAGSIGSLLTAQLVNR